MPLAALLLLVGCAPESDFEREDLEGFDVLATSCSPLMSVFPVGDAHNIGYDHASCGTGTCEISCPDANANSDWGGDHHGIDVFAYQRAPLVAVADGSIEAVGTPSSTSGLRVRLEDACGWQYYYGHMDEAVVSAGDWVEAGDLLGYMGYTGTSSTHLHFNVSPEGDYSNDIDPFELLEATSGTACGGVAEEPDDGGGSSGGFDTGGAADTGDGGEHGTGGDSWSGDDGSSGGDGGSGGGSEPMDSSDGATTGSCGWAAGTTYLGADEGLGSCDGRFTLLMQSDGNLVLYLNGGGALWHAGTHGHAGAWAAMQDDGNLVVYSSGGSALWASGTSGHPGAVLWVQDDGNLVIYEGTTAIWHTGTHGY